jgi:4-hydroxybenzoyl-CoA thioesterase
MSFSFAQPVLFRHCDPAGIVFYPRYFEMINDCVEAFFDQVLGLPFSALHQVGGVPTAEITTRFLRPSRIGDQLVLELECLRLGRSSLGIKVEARCGDETRFIAESTLVYINDQGRPTAWPDAVRGLLADQTKGS